MLINLTDLWVMTIASAEIMQTLENKLTYSLLKLGKSCTLKNLLVKHLLLSFAYYII